MSIILLRYTDGNPCGFASIMRDGTKTREREQELKARITELEAEFGE